MALRLSPRTTRTPSSSPEWHPDCYLERDALPPCLQSGTQTVTWNETHSLLVSRVALRLSPGTRHTPPSSPEWHSDCHLEQDALSPRLQSGTQTVTWNETHSLLVSRVAPRLSPGTRRTPPSSPEWHPDCHLERDTFSPHPALPTLGTWPALGIPLAPSSATQPGSWSRDALKHRAQRCHPRWHLVSHRAAPHRSGSAKQVE